VRVEIFVVVLKYRIFTSRVFVLNFVLNWGKFSETSEILKQTFGNNSMSRTQTYE
jgi:hypothetical protein